jgi:hypothetical protein
MHTQVGIAILDGSAPIPLISVLPQTTAMVQRHGLYTTTHHLLAHVLERSCTVTASRSIGPARPFEDGQRHEHGMLCVRCAPHPSADTVHECHFAGWWIISQPRHKGVPRRDGKDGRCHLILEETSGAEADPRRNRFQSDTNQDRRDPEPMLRSRDSRAAIPLTQVSTAHSGCNHVAVLAPSRPPVKMSNLIYLKAFDLAFSGLWVPAPRLERLRASRDPCRAHVRMNPCLPSRTSLGGLKSPHNLGF